MKAWNLGGIDKLNSNCSDFNLIILFLLLKYSAIKKPGFSVIILSANCLYTIYINKKADTKDIIEPIEDT